MDAGKKSRPACAKNPHPNQGSHVVAEAPRTLPVCVGRALRNLNLGMDSKASTIGEALDQNVQRNLFYCRPPYGSGILTRLFLFLKLYANMYVLLLLQGERSYQAAPRITQVPEKANLLAERFQNFHSIIRQNLVAQESTKAPKAVLFKDA